MLRGVQGIFGGTFDPPHFGHLEVARTAYHQLGLDSVRLMPAGDPWQKDDIDVSSAADRWAMTELLAAHEPWLVADATEITRDGPSYTIDTVGAVGGRSTLILGADAAMGIKSWHRSGDLLDIVDIAVVPRDGISRGDIEAALNREIIWLEMEPIRTSSTGIRAAVRSGQDLDGAVPDTVEDYISERGLYMSPTSRHGKSLSSPSMEKISTGATEDAINAARVAAAAISAKSGENIMLLDLSELLVVTDIFLLATGSSRRNVLSLVDEAIAALRELDREPIRKEGTDHGKWVLLDYGDVIIHVFDKATRDYYDLEHLWADAPRIEFVPSPSITDS